MSQNRPKTVTEYAYEHIKNKILAGEYQPGEKLTEGNLADELEVSRTPIRDAIQRLASEGLIVATPHKGYTVTKMSRKDVKDFYQTRMALEGWAAKLAALHATDIELEHFKKKLADMEKIFNRDKELASYKEIAKSNNEFHKIIRTMAKNNVLSKLIEGLDSPITVIRSTAWTTFKERKVDTFKEHLEIANAIISRNEKLAQERMEYHIYQAGKVADIAISKREIVQS